MGVSLFIRLIMALSNQTISKIADAVKLDVISNIYENEKYAEMMQDLITQSLHKTMGEMDDDLFFDLCMVLFDRIELK
jgi:protoheme ferro-lyase